MKGIDIRKYPLTNRLCQSLFKEASQSKSIDIVFKQNVKNSLQKHYKIDDKFKDNKYINLIKDTSILYNRKCSYIPKNNANFIDIKSEKKIATYYSFNYIKKNATTIETLLTSLLDHMIIQKTRSRFSGHLVKDNKILTFFKKIGIGILPDENCPIFYDYAINYLYNESRRYSAADFLIINIDNITNDFYYVIDNKRINLNEKDSIEEIKSKLNNLRLYTLSKLLTSISPNESRYWRSPLSILTKILPNTLEPESSKIGKVFNKIFDNIKPNEIEELIKCISGIHEINRSEQSKIIELTGDEIVEFYNGSKYSYNSSDYIGGGGPLGSSCMKYVSCRDRFEIYEKNPDIIKLIVLMDDSFKKIKARALLWDNKFLDRIYYDNDKSKSIIYSYAINKGYQNANGNNGAVSGGTKMVKLKEWSFDYYPYLDSFNVLDQVTGYIYTPGPNDTENPIVRLKDQSLARANSIGNGRKIINNVTATVKSICENKNILITSAVYSRTLSSFIEKKEAIYINGLDEFDHKRNSKKYDYCIKIYSGSSKENLLFRQFLYPVSESVFIDELSYRVHISNLEYNSETCEFELVFPETKSEKNEKV